MTVSPLVRGAIAAHFAPAPARELVALLAATPLPFLEPTDRTRDRDRVHLAVLKLAAGDVTRFRASLALAGTDWRDVLMSAGLADDDWPHVLAAAGLPVP